jgi:hypothetical protein
MGIPRRGGGRTNLMLHSLCEIKVRIPTGATDIHDDCIGMQVKQVDTERPSKAPPGLEVCLQFFFYALQLAFRLEGRLPCEPFPIRGDIAVKRNCQLDQNRVCTPADG